jgi:nicotinamidase-related amidase
MRTAFICLDLIHDISNPEGKIQRNAAQINERGVIAKVNRILKIAREKNGSRFLLRWDTILAILTSRRIRVFRPCSRNWCP